LQREAGTTMSEVVEAGKRLGKRDDVIVRRAISPNELALQLGVSPASTLRACREKRIRCVRFGKRFLIPADEAERVLREGFLPTAA
jgi:excisionase family DNA binding protein